MSALAGLIAARIRAEGPIDVAEYMRLCLAHPEHGYYRTRDPLGAAGDFTTAPEISQMFGEMIGVWLASLWVAAGRPAPLRLVELGPGRGTLMADALRAARSSGLTQAAEVWFIETSEPLRRAQAERVPQARWADTLADVPPGPMLLVANEFFDALPMRQFLKSPEGWRERLLGWDGTRLSWGLSEALPGATGNGRDWAETCPALEHIASTLAQRLAADGLAALILDYGYDESPPPGPTLQAVKAHAMVDPLESPGEADLTWLIDFAHLARLMRSRGLAAATTTQGAFLAELGIGARAAALAQARPDEASTLADALERLTSPEAMGTQFRVLAAYPHALPQPPGFGLPT
ncbi:MAG: SAM-dependent methyltransferase [Pseudomonadota bacterium]